MSTEEWVESLRKRFHDLANTTQTHEARLIRFEAKCEYFKKEIEELNESTKIVRTLQQQAMILKWLLGIITTVGIGICIKLF